MRSLIVISALLGACSGAAVAAANDRPTGARYSLDSGDPANSVAYRFDVESDRRDSTTDAPQDGNGDGSLAGPGGRRARGTPPPIAPQTIRFANVDPKHVELTVLDASNADTPETLLAERTPDGQLHAKLERGSTWAIPLALYDRVVTLANAGSGALPEAPIDAKIQPLASTDPVDGVLRVHAGSAAHVVFDGSGSVTPSFDLFTRGGPPPSGGIFGGRMGGGMRGGRGGPGGGERSTQPADATLHLDAEFDRFMLARADGTETLAFGDSDRKRERTWSIVRVP